MADFSWRIGGRAGDGILNAGLKMFARTCLRSGLKVFANAEYPSLIRGGHNYLNVRVSDRPVFCHSKNVDILVALNLETIEKHAEHVKGGVIYDSGLNIGVPGNSYAIPLTQMANDCGSPLYKNTVAIGVTLALMGMNLDKLNEIIEELFARKGETIVEANKQAAKMGWDYAQKWGVKYPFTVSEGDDIFIDGNSAIVAGAIRGGCKFLSAYPMTPATSVMTGMAAQSRDYNIILKHTEDEIASINMAIGANYAGVRAMTCTSGGGFALMAEGLGLASQTETPIVIVESQRPGPGTGMATNSGQGDLRFMLHASTDEFPRVVIAPGDVNECFYLTGEAFNIAEKYQLPVIILVDKFLSTSLQTVPTFDQSKITIDRGKLVTDVPSGYLRYEITEDGVSPRTIPGVENGKHVASSYEHSEKGTEWDDSDNRIKMHDKRYRKMAELTKEITQPRIIGPERADLTILAWGSTKLPALEAMRILKERGISVNLLHLAFLSPFPVAKVVEVVKNSKVVVVEGNKTSQLSALIREKTGLTIERFILRYDGRSFNPEDLASVLEKMTAGSTKYVVLGEKGEVHG